MPLYLRSSLRLKHSRLAQSGASLVGRSCHSPAVGSWILINPNLLDQRATRPNSSAFAFAARSASRIISGTLLVPLGGSVVDVGCSVVDVVWTLWLDVHSAFPPYLSGFAPVVDVVDIVDIETFF